MKSLKQIVQENLKFKINRDNDVYAYHPKSWDELRQIIVDRYEELGPGTAESPIDFNDIDVSRMITFYNYPSDAGLFEGTPFEYIDISDWDVSNIKDMSFMFNNCKILKSIGDLSKWDVSGIRNMSNMFQDCDNLKSIGDISNWDVSKVENMLWMFADCNNLKTVGDLSNWNISIIENTYNMFANSGIKNIPSWYKE